MAGIKRVLSVLRSLALASWRDVRSFGSISGQNLFLFVALVALQPESAEFFGLLLAAVLLFPLLTDPLDKIPQERHATWPLLKWEWLAIRFGSLLLSPLVWVAVLMLARAGWRVAGGASVFGVALYWLKAAVQLSSKKLSSRWSVRMPAAPGVTGALMRLQWREMFHTLDPYIAFSLMAATTVYRISGKPLEPSALRILSLVVALAMSTEAQVLLGIDGRGAERYRQLPIRGWRILLAKDLAFLALLGLLVLPLDFISGMSGGVAALAIGHHRSVMNPVPQPRWRFTSGAIVMDGVFQTMALFAVGLNVESAGWALGVGCVVAWLVSTLFYGWRWDRQNGMTPGVRIPA